MRQGKPPQGAKHGFKSFERVSPQLVSKRAFVRTERLTVVFTPGEMVDLQVIANVWDTVPKTVAWWLVANELAMMRDRDFYEMPWAADVRRELVRIGRVHRYDLRPEERRSRGKTQDTEQADSQQPTEDPGELLSDPADDGGAHGSLWLHDKEDGGRDRDDEC